MKADTIFKGYALRGMTPELAELVEPKDLTVIKKIERELADAIVADKHAARVENGLPAVAMKRRVSNIKRSSNYLDCYMGPIARQAHPRGVVISYPNGDGPSHGWHGNKWSTDTRRRFDFEIADARDAVMDWKRNGIPVRETQCAVSAIGGRWHYAIHELLARLTQRRGN